LSAGRDNSIGDILPLAALPQKARLRQLEYIVGKELAPDIAAILALPAKDASRLLARLVPSRPAAKRTTEPCDDVNPRQWFTRSLLEEVRAACETPREYAMVAAGYWCGLRAVEYTLLAWQDLGWNPQDCRGSRPDVLRVTRVKKHRRVRNEIRTRMVHEVVLDGGTVRALRQWWAGRSGAELDSPWIFPGANGGQACRKTIVRHWQRVTARCPSYDPSQYRWRRVHSLRHTVAVHMVEGGFEMADIQTRLGHDSASSTQVYAQMSTPRLRTTTANMCASHAILGF